jgi:hypothetical protein
MNAQSSPEERQASFKQSYTILIAFLNAILPPVITTSTDDAPSTAHEIALGKQICPGRNCAAAFRVELLQGL